MTRNGVKEKLVELLTEKEIRHRMFEERLHVFKGRRRIPDELFLEEEKLVIPRLIDCLLRHHGVVQPSHRKGFMSYGSTDSLTVK